MAYSRYFGLCAGLVFLSLPACAATQAADGVKQGGADDTPTITRSLTGSYLSGRYASNTGDIAGAADYLTDALEKDPQNVELLSQAFRLNVSNGNIPVAVDLAGRLRTLKSTKDPLVDTLLMLDRVKHADYAAAGKFIDVPEADGFNAILIPLLSAWMDLAQGKMKAPLKMDDVAEAAGNFAPFVQYHLALINDAAGYEKVAEKYYTSAVKDAVRVPYRVAESFANFQLRHGKPDAAAALLEQYKKSNPETYLLEDSLNQNNHAGAPLTPTVANAQEGVAELYFAIASVLYSEDVLPDSLGYLNMALYLRPDFPAAHLMQGSVYEQMDRPDKAIAAYQAIDAASPLWVKAQLRAAFNQDRKGATEDALKQLTSLARSMPDRYDPWLTRGDILRGHKRFDEAVTAYSEAIKRLPKLEAHHWPILYVRGIALERAGKWDLAEADLKRALELEPGQPDVLNYLGYSWVVMGKHVEDAKKMLEQALAARPQDPQIIDSMGWTLYLTGEYEKAVTLLESAVELLPGDATINEHLGDAYARVGRDQEAKFQWERALTFEKDEKNAAIIRKKLTDGLPPLATKKQE